MMDKTDQEKEKEAANEIQLDQEEIANDTIKITK